MKNEKIMKLVATGILVAGLMASSSGLSLAAGDSTNGPDVSQRMLWQTGDPGAAGVATGQVIISTSKMSKFNQNILKEALADLVTAGTITQAQSDAVLTDFQNNTPEKPVIKVTPPSEGANNLSGTNPMMTFKVVKFNDPLKDLVDKGTITQDQAQAIRDKMREITDQQMQKQWQTSLDTLVGEGTITRDQADKVLAFLTADKQKMQSVLDQARENTQNMRNQTKDMSPQERAQYLEQNMPTIKDPVTQMVDQGIITQRQADAVRGVLTSGGPVVFFSTSGAASGDSQN
ncbi:MAG: hypothetical protein GX425_06440 [Peptococcaceae bacterium]|nr:hypothetical protein [Peptococcaceae bacterium]